MSSQTVRTHAAANIPLRTVHQTLASSTHTHKKICDSQKPLSSLFTSPEKQCANSEHSTEARLKNWTAVFRTHLSLLSSLVKNKDIHTECAARKKTAQGFDRASFSAKADIRAELCVPNTKLKNAPNTVGSLLAYAQGSFWLHFHALLGKALNKRHTKKAARALNPILTLASLTSFYDTGQQYACCSKKKKKGKKRKRSDTSEVHVPIKNANIPHTKNLQAVKPCMHNATCAVKEKVRQTERK